MPLGPISPEVCLHNLQMPLGLYVVCIPVSTYKDTGVLGLGSTPMTAFKLMHLFKGPISNYSNILRLWGSEYNIRIM